MTDHAHELRRHARKIAHPAGDVPAVMLAAADEIERLQSVIAGLRQLLQPLGEPAQPLDSLLVVLVAVIHPGDARDHVPEHRSDQGLSENR